MMMWNRFISSPYAHLATAVAVTMGLVLVVLTVDPKKPSLADAGSAARRAPVAAAAPATLASDGIRLIRNNDTTGKSP